MTTIGEVMKIKSALVLAVTAMTAQPALAADYAISLNNGRFEPAEVNIPAGKKITLLVTNNEKDDAEFESYQLGREQVIKPGKSEEIFIGPLDAGSYEFFDDYNAKAKGLIVVK